MITLQGKLCEALLTKCAAAGCEIWHEDGVPTASDEVAAQAIIDAFALTELQAEIASRIDAHAAAMRDRAVAGISPAEMASWSIKRTEAMAYSASSNAADAPTLGIEAAARGVPLSAIVSRVLASAAALSGLEATIAGISGKHKDAVKAAPDFAAALTYDWTGGWPNV